MQRVVLRAKIDRATVTDAHGAMAHIGGPGDVVIIIADAHLNDAELATHRARTVHVDAANRVREEVAVS